MQKIIVKAVAGSYLFGLNTETSDTDYKGIFIESLDNIILGKASKNINISSNKSDKKNTSEDIDVELKELRTFINDCLKGQTYACELLFTPKDKVIENSIEWDYIQTNRQKLIPADLSPFIGYAFNQSQKYSLRGTRLAELNRVIDWMELQDRQALLLSCYENLEKTKYTYYELYKNINNLQIPDEPRLCCLGIILQLNKPIKDCLAILNKRANQYGDRSKTNMDNGGVDWKAYSHAFRLIYEWEQLLTNQELTFPIPNRDFILSVKKGEIPFSELQDKLYDEFERIQKIPNTLPKPDKLFWENWLLSLYKK